MRSRTACETENRPCFELFKTRLTVDGATAHRSATSFRFVVALAIETACPRIEINDLHRQAIAAWIIRHLPNRVQEISGTRKTRFPECSHALRPVMILCERARILPPSRQTPISVGPRRTNSWSDRLLFARLSHQKIPQPHRCNPLDLRPIISLFRSNPAGL